jgi:hypothetical protein
VPFEAALDNERKELLAALAGTKGLAVQDASQFAQHGLPVQLIN